MKNRVMGILLVIAVCIAMMPTTALANGYENVDVYVNGYKLVTDQPAIIYQDRTMVPIRAICESLGCDVEWDDNTQTAHISNEMTILAVQIDNYNISKKDRRELDGVQTSIAIDVPPIIYNNRTLVPVRAIAEMMSAIVEWDDNTRSVKITSTEYDFIDPFEENGLARVRKGNMHGFIDKKGNVVVPIKYGDVKSFSEGLAAAYGYERQVYVDENGNEVIRLEENFMGGFFSEGLAYVANTDTNKMGFIDKNGNIAIPMIYDWEYENDVVQCFCNGIAPVRKNGKWGFVNKDNKQIIPFQYNEVYSSWYYGFDGFIPVKKNNKWGIIDQRGNTIVPFVLDDFVDFYSDYALAVYEGSTIEFYVSDFVQSGDSFDEWISDNYSGSNDVEVLYSFQVIQGPTWVNEHYIWPNKPENVVYNCMGFMINVNTEAFIDRTNEVVVCVKPKGQEWQVLQVETVEYTTGDYQLDVWFDEPIDLEEFCCYPNVSEEKNGTMPWNLGNAEAFYYIK